MITLFGSKLNKSNLKLFNLCLIIVWWVYIIFLECGGGGVRDRRVEQYVCTTSLNETLKIKVKIISNYQTTMLLIMHRQIMKYFIFYIFYGIA